jgi:quercetin dioxygenase-like cupin family protein
MPDGAPTPSRRTKAQVVDLAPLLEDPGDGVHWTLSGPSELNANLVRLEAGHAVAEHRNDAVDVLVVLLAGGGHLTVDGRAVELRPHVVAHVPRGSDRRLDAGPDGLSYLTVHVRRAPLGVGPRRGGVAGDPAGTEGHR